MARLQPEGLAGPSPRLLLLGFGGVGRAFAAVLDEARPGLRDRHGIEPRLVGVRRADLEAEVAASRPAETWAWRPRRPLEDLLAATAPDVVVQAVPGDKAGSRVALEDVLTALRAGCHVVSATKSPLAERWAEIHGTAIENWRAVRVSAAAGAALPAVDLARRGIRALGCERLRGSLNGTSNAVLEAMAAGRDLDAALADARAAGIAEPDATADLDGSDAAAKIVILANLTWGTARSLREVEREAIDPAAAERAQRAWRDGLALRAVASAEGPSGALRVRLDEVGPADPFYRLAGAEKAVVFGCGRAGSIVVSGGRSDPRSAALALLKDVVNLATGDASPGLD